MTYEQVKNLKPTEFKRLCGVYPETFQEMVKVVVAEKILQKKTGRPSKVSIEDQILMTLTKRARISDVFPHRNKFGSR
jgi:hypothetical protein